MAYIIAMSLCCRASHAITPAVAHLIIPVYFYLYNMQYCKTTKYKYIMNKKYLWQILGMICLFICIALFPTSAFISYINHSVAIAMLYASPVFLILFVVCAYIDYIKNNASDND